MNILKTSAVLTALLSLTACGGEIGPDVCALAGAHLQQCFGVSSASMNESCDPDQAEWLLSRNCSTLSSAMMGGKADDTGLDAQLRKAVQEAIRKALVAGFKQAINAVKQALGNKLGVPTSFYVALFRADSEQTAQLKADELDLILSGEKEFDPTVLEMDGTFYVMHGKCPFKLDDLADKLAKLSMDHPKLIKAIGGKMVKKT